MEVSDETMKANPRVADTAVCDGVTYTNHLTKMVKHMVFAVDVEKHWLQLGRYYVCYQNSERAPKNVHLK